MYCSEKILKFYFFLVIDRDNIAKNVIKMLMKYLTHGKTRITHFDFDITIIVMKRKY